MGESGVTSSGCACFERRQLLHERVERRRPVISGVGRGRSSCSSWCRMRSAQVGDAGSGRRSSLHQAAALQAADQQATGRIGPSSETGVQRVPPASLQPAPGLPGACEHAFRPGDQLVVPLRTWREGIAVVPRRLGVRRRAAAREVERLASPRASSARLGPLLDCDAALPVDVGDELAGARVAQPASERQHDRQRHLAFAQVAADRLAERVVVGGEVEQVVDDLERRCRY